MISSKSITNTRENKFYSVYFCLSKRFVVYWKMVSLPVVLLLFITSNYPQEKLNEGILSPPTAQPEKGFVDNGKSPKDTHSQVNDLTTAEFKFPDDHTRVKVISNKKIIREKVVPDQKQDEKDKIPVPLYSLVKNDCGDGYALDENGVCQKTISARSGKKFDSDKRRKRHILDYEWMTQRKKRTNASLGDDFRKSSVKCGELYPGMTSDGNGGCKKSGEHLNKTLPP